MQHKVFTFFGSVITAFLLAVLLLSGSLLRAESPSLSLLTAGMPADGLLFLPVEPMFPDGSILQLDCGTNSFEGQYIQTDSDTAFLAALLPKELVKLSQSTTKPLELKISVQNKRFTPVKKDKLEITTAEWKLVHQANRQGGLPSRIEFTSGLVLDKIVWEDRIYDNDNSPANKANFGPWLPSNDRHATIELVSDGTACTVVRQTARFCGGGERTPDSQPKVVYYWFYFKTKEAPIYVRAQMTQKTPHPWKELHFMELHPSDLSFSNWLGADIKPSPAKQYTGTFNKEKTGRFHYNQWFALSTKDNNYIAYQTPAGFAYGDLAAKRIYLNAGWNGWKTENTSSDLWLSLGTADNIETAIKSRMITSHAPRFIRHNISSSDWQKTLANLTNLYRFIHRKDTPNNREFKTFESSDLVLVWESTKGVLENGSIGQTAGITGLIDKRTGEALSEKLQPLFKLEIENLTKKETLSLTSLSGWNSIVVKGNNLIFTGPLDLPEAKNLTATLTVSASSSQPGIHFKWKGETKNPDWRMITATVGTISLANFGPGMTAIYPGDSGTLVNDPVNSGVQYRSTYPSFKATMSWLAAWEQSAGLGLYVAAHDPWGATRQVLMTNTPGSNSVELGFNYILPVNRKDASRPTGISGEVVWQTFSGDWFNATLIYRDWVRDNASWFPEMGPEGRVDTPDWMKHLSVWGRVFGAADNVLPIVTEFRKTLGIPCGIHWYQWHKIPFDNDYPHYFPAKDGFKEAVAEIQKDGNCFVMPYTNGRLWDTRDKEDQDWQFTSVGKAGVCKRADGSPYVESYRSKEKDGSKVVLGAMCPGSKTWHDKIVENDGKLANEYGVMGVYMDQIACAGPVPCEDPTHGHPLRGGTWWVSGYRKLLQDARAGIPKDRIFASESNTETCVNLLHGMVCWHIEAENVVPAWSTIYSGVASVYGRSYDKNINCMKMKWAQCLTFGDQLGWFPPEFLRDQEMRDYFLPVVHFRHNFIEYFYKGEGARPPVLMDPVPQITEDWNVFGRKSINTVNVVQTGARRIMKYQYTKEGKRDWSTGKVNSVLLIFTNASKENAESRIRINWKELEIEPAKAVIYRVDSRGTKTPMATSELQKQLAFPAGQTWGIELFQK